MDFFANLPSSLFSSLVPLFLFSLFLTPIVYCLIWFSLFRALFALLWIRVFSHVFLPKIFDKRLHLIFGILIGFLVGSSSLVGFQFGNPGLHLIFGILIGSGFVGFDHPIGVIACPCFVG